MLFETEEKYFFIVQYRLNSAFRNFLTDIVGAENIYTFNEYMDNKSVLYNVGLNVGI